MAKRRKFRTSTRLKRGVRKTMRKTRIGVGKSLVAVGKRVQPKKRRVKKRRVKRRRHS